jgi:hypothetical protein
LDVATKVLAVTAAHKRHWSRWSPRTLFVVVSILLAVTTFAWYWATVAGALTPSDIWAIRKTIASDPRTQRELILEIGESQGVAEVVVGVQGSQSEGKGRIVCLQKRHGKWTIVTFSRLSMRLNLEPVVQRHWRRWEPNGNENEP